MTDLTVEPVAQARTSPNWLHTINLIWNGLAFLTLAPLSVASFIEAPNAGLNTAFGGVGDRTFYLFAYICAFFAAMGLIGFIDSARKLNKKSKPVASDSGHWLYFLILAFPIVLMAIYQWESLMPAWLFSLLLFLAILLPVIWIMRVASGRIWGRHPGRDASLFSWSLGLSTPFIMLVQLLVIVVMLLVLLAPIIGDFTAIPELNDFEALLKRPGVIFAVFLMLSVFVPIIEELFKTLAMLPLLGLRISPGEGYMAGMVSGAAFALFEGAMYASQAAMTSENDWLFFILGRLGGSLLHIFNGALIGWALAKTWQDKRIYRVLLAYLIAILAHGLWNFIVFITQLAPTMQGKEVKLQLTIWLMIALGLVIAGGFGLLAAYISNQKKAAAPVDYAA